MQYIKSKTIGVGYSRVKNQYCKNSIDSFGRWDQPQFHGAYIFATTKLIHRLLTPLHSFLHSHSHRNDLFLRLNAIVRHVFRLVSWRHRRNFESPAQGRRSLEGYRRSLVRLSGGLVLSPCSYCHLAASKSTSSRSFGSRLS